MAHYPIIFSLHDLVQGDGFLASVNIEGRALLHDDEDSFWVEGVCPGGFAGTGSGQAAALENFRLTYRSLLFDMAAEEKNFDGFKQAVGEFFENTCAQPKQDWDRAVKEVREGRLDAPGMTRRSADSPPRIEVLLISEPASKYNEIEAGAALAA